MFPIDFDRRGEVCGRKMRQTPRLGLRGVIGRFVCLPLLLPVLAAAARPALAQGADARETPAALAARIDKLLGADNLVAWCIVPFDAGKRTPQQRAEMVRELGLHRVAYDWREEHVPTFEEEILQYKAHGLEFFAFWSWHDAFEPLVRRYGIKPQIWFTCPSPEAEDDQRRVAAAAAELLPLVRKTAELRLPLGLYNHGGWGGEPQNMVAIVQYLRNRYAAEHVGIVYNFHHGHGHSERFADALKQMQPYLLCVNLNGMCDANEVSEQQILPIGAGRHEFAMIRQLITSGYEGAIGILDHREQVDAAESLRQNLDGLRELTARLKR